MEGGALKLNDWFDLILNFLSNHLTKSFYLFNVSNRSFNLPYNIFHYLNSAHLYTHYKIKEATILSQIGMRSAFKKFWKKFSPTFLSEIKRAKFIAYYHITIVSGPYDSACFNHLCSFLSLYHFQIQFH